VFHPRMQMNRVIENIRTTKRTAQMYFIQGSWTRENVGFTIAKSDSPRVLRFRNHVQNGHDLCKGQNITGLMCRVDILMLQFMGVCCSILNNENNATH